MEHSRLGAVLQACNKQAAESLLERNYDRALRTCRLHLFFCGANMPAVPLRVGERGQIDSLAIHRKPQRRRRLVPAGICLLKFDDPDQAGITGLDVAHFEGVVDESAQLVRARAVMLAIYREVEGRIKAQGKVFLGNGIRCRSGLFRPV